MRGLQIRAEAPRGGSSAVTDLTDDDPDEPESSRDERHDGVSDEREAAVGGRAS